MSENPLSPAWLASPSDANELWPTLWPVNATRGVSGEMTVAGVGVSALVAESGTPVYVVDEADVRARATRVLAAFTREFARVGTRAKVYYAGKAFLCTEVARWMSEAGLGIDVCTGGELAVALAAGVDPATIGFHGNNKSAAEIERAVNAAVGTIVIDSLQEIDRVADAATRHDRLQNVRLRVNNGVHAGTHDFLATAHEDQKFGIPLDAAAEAVAGIRSQRSLSFLGLHCHIGSQIFAGDGFVESARRLLALHAELLAGGSVPELNLGGGFGIAYTSADRPEPIETIAAGIADAVAAECARLGIPIPAVAFEPGRLVIGPSTITLYTVGTTKDVPVTLQETDGGVSTEASTSAIRKYVSIDGGMSDNARRALYGADYSVRIASRASVARPELVRLAGKHCESGDIVVDADYLPGDVAPGDLVAVAATGAYCWSLSSNYNYVPRPPVVAVTDGVARVIVRGETESDILARDAGVGSDTGVNKGPTA